MIEKINTPVDINLATPAELTQVPGIGPALAEKILNERPFSEISDLTRVSGINEAVLEKFKPFLTISSPSPELMVEEIVTHPSFENDGGSEEDELSTAEVSEEISNDVVEIPESLTGGEIEEETSIAAPTQVSETTSLPENTKQKNPQHFSRSDAIWVGVVIAILVLAFSLVLNLGTLGIINQTLSYAPSSEVRALNNELGTLTNRISNLESDITSLQSRLNAFEGLSGRVADLERADESFQRDLAAAQEQLDTLKTQSARLTSQVDELQRSSSVFQRFLDGLKNLLSGE